MMLRPSYHDLMKVVNENVEIGEEPVVNSRYSIVIASAKRARQIIAGDEPLVPDAEGKKPLSIAVEELYKGEVKILAEDDSQEEAAASAGDAESDAEGNADSTEEPDGAEDAE